MAGASAARAEAALSWRRYALPSPCALVSVFCREPSLEPSGTGNGRPGGGSGGGLLCLSLLVCLVGIERRCPSEMHREVSEHARGHLLARFGSVILPPSSRSGTRQGKSHAVLQPRPSKLAALRDPEVTDRRRRSGGANFCATAARWGCGFGCRNSPSFDLPRRAVGLSAQGLAAGRPLLTSSNNRHGR